jgi:hypothetical protein
MPPKESTSTTTTTPSASLPSVSARLKQPKIHRSKRETLREQLINLSILRVWPTVLLDLILDYITDDMVMIAIVAPRFAADTHGSHWNGGINITYIWVHPLLYGHYMQM